MKTIDLTTQEHAFRSRAVDIATLIARSFRSLTIAVLFYGYASQAGLNAAVITEGGENGLGGVTVQVPANFPVLSSTVYADTAPHSFHLGHIGFNPEDQWLMLNSPVATEADTELQFQS